MPTIHDLKQSRYLTKEDCGKGLLLTIKGFRQENVAGPSEPQKLKYILEFEEGVKPMTLNGINGNTIAEITGSEDFAGWIGHRIVAYADPNVEMSGERVGGIRVRAPRLGPVPGVTAPTVPGRAPQPAPAPGPRPVAPRVVSPPPSPAPAYEAAEPEDDDVPF